LGLLKGFGKGLIGIPVKPVTGLFDFATKTTEGISNVRNYFETVQRGRVRLPRTFSKEGLLIPYSEADSYAQFILLNTSNGMFQHQKTLYLFENEKDTIILLTSQSLICVKKSSFSLEWRIDIHTIIGCQFEKDGAICVTYPQTAFKNGSRRIFNPDPRKMEAFYKKLDSEITKWKMRKSNQKLK
jgi:vacuolar protein sorting-associated protein 13A/C